MSTNNIVTLKGTIVTGPAKASCAGFPSGVAKWDFELSPPSKAANVSFSANRNLNSSGSYAALDGVGAGKSVTAATTLYVRTETAMLIRITFADTTTAVIPVQGLFILEAQPAKTITLLEAQGVGTIEYFAAGNA